jgi:hypothetical protein
MREGEAKGESDEERDGRGKESAGRADQAEKENSFCIQFCQQREPFHAAFVGFLGATQARDRISGEDY